MIGETLTMIPGPTPVHDRILDQLARPTVSHQAPAFVEAYARALGRTLAVVRSERGQPFIVGGAGTLAMEMALVNVLGPGDALLVVSHGYFGHRFAEIAAAFGIEHEVLASEWGRPVDPDAIAAKLSERRFAAVALTHVDTSTGVAAPVADIARLARERDALVLLDGVCATAGMDERFDEWGLDVLFTGAQKALGAPPGVGILVASPEALDRRRSMDRVPAYYADWLRWLPIMEDPGKYFSTPPVNEIAALDVALGLILDEGLEARFARHRRLAAATRAGLSALGILPFTDPGAFADTLTVARHADGIDDGDFRAAMAAEGVIVAGALGPIAGKAFRIGHMGNIGIEEVTRTLHAIESSLAGLNGLRAEGSANAAAAPHWAP